MLINSVFLPKTSPGQISTEANPLKFEGFSTLFSDLFKINLEKPETDSQVKSKSNTKDENQNEAISFVNISVFANKNIQSVDKNISDIISEVLIGPGSNLLIPEDTNHVKSDNAQVMSAKIFAVSKDEFITEIRNVLKNLQLKSDSSTGKTVLTIKTGNKVTDIKTSIDNLPNINGMLQENLEGSETFKLLFKSDKKEISVEVTPVTVKTSSTTNVKNLKQILANSTNKTSSSLNELKLHESESDVRNLTENSEKKTYPETNPLQQSGGNKIKVTKPALQSGGLKPELNFDETSSLETNEDKNVKFSLKQSGTDQNPVKILSKKSEFLNDLLKKTETKEIKIEVNKAIRQNNLRQVVEQQNQPELTKQKADTPKIKAPALQQSESVNQEETKTLPLKIIGDKKNVQQKLFTQPGNENNNKVKSQVLIKNQVKTEPIDFTEKVQQTGKQIDPNPITKKTAENIEVINKSPVIKPSESTEDVSIEKPVDVQRNNSGKNNLLVEEKIPVEKSVSTKDETKIISSKKEVIPEKNEVFQKEVLKPIKNLSLENKSQVIKENENNYSDQQKNEVKNYSQKENQQNLKTETVKVLINKPDRVPAPSENQNENQLKENVQVKNPQIQTDVSIKNPGKNFPFVEVVSEEEAKLSGKITEDEKIEVSKSFKNEEVDNIIKSNQVKPKVEKQVWVKVVVEEKSNEQAKVNVKQDFKQVKSESIYNNRNNSPQNHLKNSDDILNTNQKYKTKSNADFDIEVKQVKTDFDKNSKQEINPVKNEIVDNNKNESGQNRLKATNDQPKEEQNLFTKNSADIDKEVKQEFQKHSVESNNQKNIKIETPAGTVQLKQLVVEDKKTVSKTPQVIEKTKVLSANELLKEVYKVFEAGEKQSVVLKLIPKELGAIKITLDTIDNTLNAKVEVNNESVGHLMRNNVESLKQNLLQNGVQVNSINISFSGSEQKQSGLNHQKRRSQNFRFDNDIEINEETILPKRMGYNTYEFLA